VKLGISVHFHGRINENQYCVLIRLSSTMWWWRSLNCINLNPPR